MKYPIGIQDFSEIIDGGYVYLDKTKILYDLVHNGKIYFLSRPRRFGKSLLISTLECYFQGQKELFKGLAIEQLEKEWKQYPVFHIDFNGKDFTQAGELEKTLLTFVETQELIYGRDPLATTLGDRFMAVLRTAHEKTGLGAVVLIDEYDKPLLDVLDTGLKTFDSEGNERLLEDRHREIMKGFYSVFKAADRDLKFVNSLSKKILSDFWFRTGSPTYLVRLLAHSDENLNELTGKYYPTSSFIDYKADIEAPLPMIYQSGYLTIKDWNMDTDSYLLDFPNDEVKAGFVTMVAANYLRPKESPDAWVIEVVNTMKTGDCDKLEKLLTSFFASIPYSQRRKDDEREKERYFQYTFYLVIRMISCFTVLIEKEQSEGRVDCIVETPNFVYIFEFKRDGSALDALKQIETKGYAREYAADKRKIYQIGCNFSSETGTIDGWKLQIFSEA